ncbi:iron ABC transporter permease [Pseudonocardia kujensis]|uniref:ABC transporter permease n=1 Tax=Pseudonocardia kujensis TaxID=1128675 RepID=UPI001E3FEA3E|nr:iron ABC transporter permease [Pseudonocardia kujensis]MCE0764146.1 iron ABC transporter permease [Pseudonocardia kujensis]
MTSSTSVSPSVPALRRGGEGGADRLVQWGTWLLVIVLIFGPIVPVVYAGFVDRPLYESGGILTLGNFAALAEDPAFWAALRNTALFALFAAVPGVVIGAGLAVLVGRTDLPLRRALSVVMVAPLLFPGLGVTLGWVTMYSPSGFVSSWAAGQLGSTPWNLYSIPGMALVTLEKTVPLVYLMVRARLSALDTSIESAALTAGAGPARVLWTVTLPMLRPALLTAAILIVMIAFETLGLPLILGGPVDIDTLSTYLYRTWTSDPERQGTVSAAASGLLLLVTLLLWLRTRVEGDGGRYTTAAGKPSAARSLHLRALRWPLVLLVWCYALVAIVLPVVGLVMTSITNIFAPGVSPWSMLTSRHFETVFSNAALLRSITNSLLIGVVGAVLATAGLTLAALVAHRSRFRLRASLPPVLFYPRALPGIVVGVGTFWVFVLVAPLEPLRTTVWGIMLAFIVRNTAVGYAAIHSSLLAISTELDAAARTSGASWLRTCRDIVVPMLRPALAGCFILMFVSLLNDYDPAVFLVTTGNEVLGVTMLKQWAAGFTGPVAALGVIQIAITALAVSIGRLAWGVRPRA